jgi:3-hydroxy-5-methyl-1-naphthoate 3-O-methyltransferase
MAQKPRKPPLSPAAIMEEIIGSWRARALSAAVELDLFSQVAVGKRTAKEIAGGAGTSLRGTAALLDALVAMGYLRKNAKGYALQPISAAFLVPGKKEYAGAIANALALTWNSWKNLPEVVRSGHASEAVNVTDQGREFFPKLVASLFPGNFAASQAVVSRIPDKERRKIREILDVAAGSGAWSLAFAQAIPEARVTTVDFPETTPITRSFAQQARVADRYRYLEGDLRQVDFGRDKYDLVILGHIIHSEGAVHGQELLKKSHAALRPGGRLLIAEYVPNDARTGPPMPMLFALTMLLQTEAGSVFTLREYRAWLKATGFRKISTIAALPPATVITAKK